MSQAAAYNASTGLPNFGGASSRNVTPKAGGANQMMMQDNTGVYNEYIQSPTPSGPKKQWSLSDFEFLHKLGGGQYGDVFLANTKGCNFVCAIKQLKIERLVKYDVVGQLRREVEIAFNTRHKYLLRTYTYFYDSDSVYLVLEPCARGMLYSELNKVKKFPPETAARFTAQLGEALLYLHKHHILHRDIKPENILLDHDMNIKLADFGWSVHDKEDRRKTACGTPEYFPPEVVQKIAYSTTADLWCLGVFCYELLVGSTPFVTPGDKDPDQRAICKRIQKMDFTIPDSIPPEAADLISQLLVKEGPHRLALKEVLLHPFLVEYYYKPNGLTPPVKSEAFPLKRTRDDEENQ